MRWIRVLTIVGMTICTMGAVCPRDAPSRDSTPPKIFILYWEPGPNGSQGPQRTVNAGGTMTIPAGWLGANKADIRVYNDDDEGVHSASVTGNASGPCSTKVNSSGQFYNSPGSLSASFPKQSKTEDPGKVESSIVFHLDDLMANASCGTHQYANMPSAQEFLLDRGTWTIAATADNCCGGSSSASFTIEVT